MNLSQTINFQRGSIIKSRYEIVSRVASGSMAVVYAAKDIELNGKMVALKILLPEVARDSVSLARFRTELVAAYRVNHPNVVRVYEYFRDGEIAAYTMEYVEGGDLAGRISSQNPPPIDEVVRLLCQICSGVEAIHTHGIIHRDLKPENILLTPRGDAKISDFGIVRTDLGRKLTAHGGVVGTIDYVSPEYIGFGQLDARSDIYGIGVLAYRLITGKLPFKGGSLFETVSLRLKQDANPPSALRALCPPALDRIVLKALARDPVQRYQTAATMLSELLQLLPARLAVAFEGSDVLDLGDYCATAANQSVQSDRRSGGGVKRHVRRVKAIHTSDSDSSAATTFLDARCRMEILTTEEAGYRHRKLPQELLDTEHPATQAAQHTEIRAARTMQLQNLKPELPAMQKSRWRCLGLSLVIAALTLLYSAELAQIAKHEWGEISNAISLLKTSKSGKAKINNERVRGPVKNSRARQP